MAAEKTPRDEAKSRQIDARSLRGLAHPVRMQVLRLLQADGPATATGLAQRLGESSGTLSWHLRQLAEHGFIEEDAERGNKRERWWRATEGTTTLRAAQFRHDSATRGALSIYLNQTVEHYFQRVAVYLSEDWEAGWEHAGTLSDWSSLRLTADQLAALNAELFAVIERHTPAEPEPDAEAVVIQLQSFPRHVRSESEKST
ncbi:MAG TPA: helix-turn-helix domain-containing protein [Mycobacteriales bacterium]|jgi:DNA-binding transcriptional ArsR family regulator|nr:helix-turn-helix domain-containing protein [Mycobacteriales bacterium]